MQMAAYYIMLLGRIAPSLEEGLKRWPCIICVATPTSIMKEGELTVMSADGIIAIFRRLFIRIFDVKLRGEYAKRRGRKLSCRRRRAQMSRACRIPRSIASGILVVGAHQ